MQTFRGASMSWRWPTISCYTEPIPLSPSFCRLLALAASPHPAGAYGRCILAALLDARAVQGDPSGLRRRIRRSSPCAPAAGGTRPSTHGSAGGGTHLRRAGQLSGRLCRSSQTPGVCPVPHGLHLVLATGGHRRSTGGRVTVHRRGLRLCWSDPPLPAEHVRGDARCTHHAMRPSRHNAAVCSDYGHA